MEREILYKIKPKFNFIYEIGNSRGKKMKRTFIALMFFILFIIALNVFLSSETMSKNIIESQSQAIVANTNTFLVILTMIPLIILVAQIVFRVVQYRYTSYEFFDRYLEYRDGFLNQHEKTMEYKDVKEIEIEKNVFDRIMGFGTIVIRTNAENETDNGLVIENVRNPQKAYDLIDNIIHSKGNIIETEAVIEKQTLSQDLTREDNIYKQKQVTNVVSAPQTREEEIQEYQGKELKELEAIENIENPEIVKPTDDTIDGGIKSNY